MAGSNTLAAGFPIHVNETRSRPFCIYAPSPTPLISATSALRWSRWGQLRPVTAAERALRVLALQSLTTCDCPLGISDMQNGMMTRLGVVALALGTAVGCGSSGGNSQEQEGGASMAGAGSPASTGGSRSGGNAAVSAGGSAGDPSSAGAAGSTSSLASAGAAGAQPLVGGGGGSGHGGDHHVGSDSGGTEGNAGNAGGGSGGGSNGGAGGSGFGTAGTSGASGEGNGGANSTDGGAAGAAGTITCVNPSVAPLAWWRGEDNADDAVGERNGVDSGVTYGPGIVGRAFSFDGVDDVIELSEAQSFYPAGSFSIEAWIRLPEGASGTLIERYECGNTCVSGVSNSVFRVGISDGTLFGYVRDSDASGVDASGAQELETMTALDDGEWHHVAFVRNSSTRQLLAYVDGQLAASVGADAGIEGPLNDDDGSADPVIFGASRTAASSTFEKHLEGLVDELTYYDGALSDDDIAALHRARNLGKCE